MPLAPQSKLGSYEILGSLGAGGMGEVYRARDVRLGREVALKVLRSEITIEPGRLERFDREARAIAALNHPHIVTLYSSEEAEGVRFLTMELVDGCTLADVIPPRGVAVDQFLEIAIQLSEALAAAHQKKITHRDLKPGNVMVTGDGRVKVLDFGLARVGTPQDIDQTITPITREGAVLGTMPYMSPEQVEGLPLDPRSDLFSLGIIFYEMLNGQRPFKGGSSPALISSILRDTPTSVGESRRDVPISVCQLIDRLLEKRIEARVQTAREVVSVLKQAQRTFTGSSAEVGRGFDDGPTASQATVEIPRSDRPSPSSSGDSLGTPLSITVRPFRSGSQADASAIAEGLTTDVATRLARFGYLRVLSPAAIDQSPPPPGARYSVEGEVRSSGGTLRVSARLVDLSTSLQVWAQNFDRSNANGMFEILDDVADRIAATVADSGGELVRAVVAANPVAASSPQLRYALYLQNFSADEHARLRDAFEAIVAHEPDHKSAWGYLSLLFCQEVTFGFNQRPDPIARARSAASRAIELDATNQRSWFAHAMAAFLDHDETAFRTGAERAIELNPLSVITLATSGTLFCYSGDAKRGAELVRKAMALNPKHPGWYHAILFLDAYMSGDADAALKHGHLITMPSLQSAGLYIAAAGGRFNRADEARIGIEAWVRANNKPFDTAEARVILKRWMWEGALLEAVMDGLVRARKLAFTSPQAVEASIAVLPFADLSEKKDQDWFCEGIAEEILSALAPVPGLRVAARASAFAMRSKTDDLKTIAERLDVKSVLEGSVRRAGDRVRITAQLSDAARGRQLWAERFDRELKDIFDVQEEIARAIVDKLCLTLINDKARLVERPTTNMEAYELLLKGRVLITRRGRAVADAIPLFQRAIELDPNFAEAHAMLGDAYRLLCLYGIVRARELMPKARTAVERALAIDPNQPEALATFAIIATIYEWDLGEMLRRSDRALAVDPSHVRVLGERAISISVYRQISTGDWQTEVLDLLARARAADPLNAWAAGIETACLIMMDRLDDAIEAGRQAMALDDSNFTAHWFLTSALAAAGREDEALDAAVPALAMSGRHPMILTILSALHSTRGNAAEVEAIRAELHQRAASSFVGEAALACVDAAAGQWDEARVMLRKAISEHDPYLTFWKLYAFGPLWSDKECADMLRASSLFDEARRS